MSHRGDPTERMALIPLLLAESARFQHYLAHQGNDGDLAIREQFVVPHLCGIFRRHTFRINAVLRTRKTVAAPDGVKRFVMQYGSHARVLGLRNCGMRFATSYRRVRRRTPSERTSSIDE
ncbi:MAG: hypothetical protein AABO41_04190 [Acidobacteriota bacterium]